MNFLIALTKEATEAATSTASSAASSGFSWATVQQYLFPALMIIGLVLVFWLLIIRPQKKQEKKTAEMRNSITEGDLVTTIGGITGTVRQIKDDDTYIIETGADKSKIAVKKWAIQSKDTVSN